MLSLINFVAICDYGDGTPGSCLEEKTLNATKDAERYELAVCTGCGATHNCAIIAVHNLRLRNNVHLVNGMKSEPIKPKMRSGSLPNRRRAGLRKPT